jgi:N-acetylglutamate synthase-like GNAT family acetyltransferase
MIEIRSAMQDDLTYIDSLQKKNAEELAFFPKIVFEREINNFRILLALVNNEPAGYLYHGAYGTNCKIHQACIQYDLRGQLYGAELVRNFISLCDAAGSLSITLRCGSDISANHFWKAMGFYCQAVTQGGIRRMRDINNWRYDIQSPLFLTDVEPSEKAKDASVWAKYKNKDGNSMLRGKALAQYRAKVIQSVNDEKDG